MPHTRHNPASVPPPQGSYTQALEVQSGARLLFISGQVGIAPDGGVPSTFDDQCRLIYQNIVHLLAAANMDVTNLAKLTVFLTRPEDARRHGEIRREFLGDHLVASTAVVVAALLNPAWLLEVEAVAAG